MQGCYYEVHGINHEVAGNKVQIIVSHVCSQAYPLEFLQLRRRGRRPSSSKCKPALNLGFMNCFRFPQTISADPKETVGHIQICTEAAAVFKKT